MRSNLFLRLKHWQVFPVLIIGLLIITFKIENNQTLSTVLLATGNIIYFAWILFVGDGLYRLLPTGIELNHRLFLINSFGWLIAYVFLSTRRGVTVNVLDALLGFYYVCAALHFIMFPARTLKSIEKGKKADIRECIGYFFLILILPIGIWFLQPRINKVVQGRRTI